MAIGYHFPFQVSSGSVGYFQMTGTELDAIRSNIRVLLLTNWGERPMHYDFGCNLREFLFDQMRDEELEQKVAERILQQMAKWMPFVTLTELNVFFQEDDRSLPDNAFAIRMSFKLLSKPDSIESFTQIVTT